MFTSVAKKGIIVFIIAWIACLLACHPDLYHGKHMDLYTAAAFSVVGADFTSEINVIDRDDYGRRLVYLRIGNPSFYTYYSFDTRETMYAHVFLIVQRTVKGKVYYYEDACFRVYAKKSDFTDLDRKELEIRNDWNQPLNEERMTYRKVIKRKKGKITATEAINQSETQCDDTMRALYLAYYKEYYNSYNAFYIEVVEPQGHQSLLWQSRVLDVDRDGNMLWVIYPWDITDDRALSMKGYFMLTAHDWTLTKNAVVKEIENRDAYWEELPAFRQESGWQPF